MPYLDNRADVDFLRKLPFEWVIRNVNITPFVTRLGNERGISESQKKVKPKIGLVVLLDKKNSLLLDTVKTWSLQSYQHTELHLCAASNQSKSLIENIGLDKTIHGLFSKSSIKIWKRLSDLIEVSTCDYYVFCLPGDLLHPSLAYTIFRYKASSDLDILSWNSLSYTHDELKERFVFEYVRRPGNKPYSMMGVNYAGMAFSCSKKVLRDNRQDIENYLYLDDGHIVLLQESISNKSIIWKHHPEYLNARYRRNLMPVRARVSDFGEKYIQRTNSILAELGVEGSYSASNIRFFELKPKASPSSIAVVIPFKDKPEITIKSMESILDQDSSARIEIILIDNQSTEDSVAALRRYIDTLSQKVRIVSYPMHFNHSAQCNLGVKESTAEVIVFLNNDAELKSPQALDSLASWALLPNIGTVGGRITRANGDLVCAGIRVRLNGGYDYNSYVEESTDKVYSLSTHQTFGNTFACAAISRKRYLELSGLDEINFPIGYNDVDFSARLNKSGYVNIYIGQLTILHAPGTSRGSSDEHWELIKLRTLHPDLSSWSLLQLEDERHLLKRYGKEPPIKRYEKSIRKGKAKWKNIFKRGS